MFQELIQNLMELGYKKITVSAEGNYPNKKRTPVQKVAIWQNDGTEKIKPARFVEKAERRNRRWDGPLDKGIEAFLFDDNPYVLEQNAMRIAYDINIAVNRIKTGQLKRSMRGEVE